MKQLAKNLQAKLQNRKENHLYRSLGKTQAKEINFYSNDYLGFSKNSSISLKAEKILQQFHISQHGSTGSRLISGNHKLFQVTEEFIAHYHKEESALLFNSGYDANVGVLSSVPQRGDVILYDEFSHASIRDGIQLSAAKSYKFTHNNLTDLELKIGKFSKSFQNIYVVTESVFSMDGDSPDLKKLVDICSNKNAFVIIDEAHALGVIGDNGEGLVQILGLEKNVFARIVTFGKALGAHGAAVIGSHQLCNFLINFAKSFIYTTSLAPHTVAIIYASYQFLAKTEQRKNLEKNISYFKSQIDAFQLNSKFIASVTPIQSFIISGNENALRLAKTLEENDISAKAILSPTVKMGEERIRICLNAQHTSIEINSLLQILKNH